jgi:high-affinity Fe2+/Pb2+ permease
VGHPLVERRCLEGGSNARRARKGGDRKVNRTVTQILVGVLVGGTVGFGIVWLIYKLLSSM